MTDVETQSLNSSTVSQEERAGRREWCALAVLVLAVLLLAVDATVLSLAVPSLAEDLAPSAMQLLWIVDIYSFALAGLLVTMGCLGDRIGRKRLLLIGAFGFGSASLLAAFAPTAGWLIAARALLGVAGATIMPSTLSLIRTMFGDARQRTTAIAVWGGAATAGAALGPLIGGAVLQHCWWGSVFVINLPVMALLVVFGSWLLPESRSSVSAPLDLIGAALSVAAVVAAVYAVKHLAADGFDVTVAAAGTAAVVCGAWFTTRQRRAAVPLLDLGLFASRAFTGAVAANMLAVFALSGLLFYLSQYLQLVRGMAPFAAGVAQAPMSVAGMLTAVLAGAAVARLGRGRTIAAGLGCAATGVGVLAAVEAVGEHGWLTGALCVTGLGVGLALTVTTDAIVSAVPAERAGAAAAVSETGYELGTALGIALLGSLHTALYRSHLHPPDGLAADLAATARESLASALAAAGRAPLALHTPVVTAGREAFVSAMQVSSVVTAVLLATAAVLSWLLNPTETSPATPARPSLSVGPTFGARRHRWAAVRAVSYARRGTLAAAGRGDPAALAALVDRFTATRRDWDHVEALAAGGPVPGSALMTLAAVRVRRRQWAEAERLAHRAADHGTPAALTVVAVAACGAHRLDDVRRLAIDAARRGDPGAITHLTRVCRAAGHTELLGDLTTTTVLIPAGEQADADLTHLTASTPLKGPRP